MGALSPWHWLLVLVIVLLIFGPSRLPEAGKSLGKAIRGFKDALSGMDEKDKEEPSASKSAEEKPSPSKPELKG